MNFNLVAILIAVAILFVASFFINATSVVNFITDYVEIGINLITGLLLTIVGACFYFILRVAGIFESHKEIKDFLFYEIKEALENNRFAYFDSGVVQIINALVKLTDPTGDHFYIVVNNDFRTLHSVTPCGMSVTINQSSIRFLQDDFLSIEDLVNYINTRTRHRVDKYEIIIDSIPE